MNRKSGSGSGLFMMEMIAAVFFFILCASTCIMVFVKANNMSRKAKDTNQSVIAAESIAEIWKAEGMDGIMTRMSEGNPTMPEDGSGCLVISWNRNWKLCSDAESAAYQAKVVETQEGFLHKIHITVSRVEDELCLFELDVDHYIPEE